MRLQDKVAIVTGAASGIGLATAQLFAREGARLVLGDIDEVAGAQAADEIASAGGDATFLSTDVTSSTDIQRLVDEAVERHGRLDVMVNNAGVVLTASVPDTSEEAFDRVVGVNLKGVFLGCKMALPHLLDNPAGGVIVNNASNGGLVGRPGDPVYTAAKHGVMGLTKSLALTYADRRVRVNAVCPGAVDTPLIWNQLPPGTDREAHLRRVLATSPTPRMAAPEEVARAVLFLAGDDSSYVNGVGLAVDGGKAAGIFNIDRYRTDFEVLG